ncbi:hypothetical protein OIV83_006082 [Microbotryomycetes sp. JL201]|nr:hypothetical protein OIV83_006082 [Microbotryomycetes sp. JL201]
MDSPIVLSVFVTIMFEGAAGLRLHTFIYKTVDGVSITADVGVASNTGTDANVNKQLPAVPPTLHDRTHHAIGSSGDRQKRPLMVFVHGGGLVAGNKLGWLPAWLLKDAFDQGFVVLSPDYTLLRPKTAHDTLQDVLDLWTWIHNNLNSELATKNEVVEVDLSKVVVTGASAGGLLTWWFAIHAEPKPKAICPIYPGGGALIADHYLQPETWMPDKGPRTDRLSQDEVNRIEHETARIVRTDVSGAGVRRALYFPLCLGRGDYLDAFAGQSGLGATLRSLPSLEQRRQAIPKQHWRIFPELATVDQSFPPTIYVHGTADDGVLIEESRAMKRKLDEAGVECVAIEVPGKGHGFDLVYKDSKECPGLDKVVPFLCKFI